MPRAIPLKEQAEQLAQKVAGYRTMMAKKAKIFRGGDPAAYKAALAKIRAEAAEAAKGQPDRGVTMDNYFPEGGWSAYIKQLDEAIARVPQNLEDHVHIWRSARQAYFVFTTYGTTPVRGCDKSHRYYTKRHVQIYHENCQRLGLSSPPPPAQTSSKEHFQPYKSRAQPKQSADTSPQTPSPPLSVLGASLPSLPTNTPGVTIAAPSVSSTPSLTSSPECRPLLGDANPDNLIGVALFLPKGGGHDGGNYKIIGTKYSVADETRSYNVHFEGFIMGDSVEYSAEEMGDVLQRSVRVG